MHFIANAWLGSEVTDMLLDKYLSCPVSVK
jgi:hypothetical protein